MRRVGTARWSRRGAWHSRTASRRIATTHATGLRSHAGRIGSKLEPGFLSESIERVRPVFAGIGIGSLASMPCRLRFRMMAESRNPKDLGEARSH